MRGLLHALEPLWWGLFVTGTFLSALLLPGLLLAVLLAPGAVASADVHAVVTSLPGRLLFAVLVITCLWNGAHHLRHFNIDLGGLSRDTGVAWLLYAVAGVGSLWALAIAFGL